MMLQNQLMKEVVMLFPEPFGHRLSSSWRVWAGHSELLSTKILGVLHAVHSGQCQKILLHAPWEVRIFSQRSSKSHPCLTPNSALVSNETYFLHFGGLECANFLNHNHTTLRYSIMLHVLLVSKHEGRVLLLRPSFCKVR